MSRCFIRGSGLLATFVRHLFAVKVSTGRCPWLVAGLEKRSGSFWLGPMISVGSHRSSRLRSIKGTWRRRRILCSMERYDWVQILSIATLALTAGVICAVLLTL